MDEKIRSPATLNVLNVLTTIAMNENRQGTGGCLGRFAAELYDGGLGAGARRNVAAARELHVETGATSG